MLGSGYYGDLVVPDADFPKEVHEADARGGTGEVRGMMLRNFTTATPRSPFLGGDDKFSDFDEEVNGVMSMLGDTNHRKRGKYARSIIRSKRAKRGCLIIVASSILIGMIVGITKANRNRNLPDWEGLLAEERSKKGQEQHQSQGGVMEGKEDDYGHTDIASAETAASIILSDVLADAQSHSTVYNPGSMTVDHEFYIVMADKHHPVWFSRNADNYPGTNYEWAIKYCESIGRNERMVLCPYEAYCPAGPGNVPAGGHFKDEGGGHVQYSPMSDYVDGWVQVSSDGGNGCIPEPPGEKPYDGVETQTRYEYGEAEIHEPKWYDRSSGWDGRTYDEASAFCIREHPSGIGALCPFSVVCPIGPRRIPYGGVEVDHNATSLIQWTPLANSPNDWVMVGAGNDVCMTHVELNYENPLWGQTGEDSEEITRYLICCRNMTVSADSTTVPVIDSDGGGEGGGGTTATTASDTELWYDEGHIFEPVWYDRSSGWEGRTYDDASSFCANNHAGGVGELCEYEAVCPNGPRNTPIGGAFENYDENGMVSKSLVQWTAIGDSFNDWVMIGPGNDVCRTYMSVHYDNPIWGLTGKDSEEMTQAIVCCRKATASAASSQNETVASATSDSGTGGEVTTTQLYPVWYDRSTGWEGRTYDEAVSFCESLGSGEHQLCNYETYCPMGSGNAPFSGGLNETTWSESTWAPLGDAYNHWVQLGNLNEMVCTKFDSYTNENPSWGISGEASYKFTGYLMCCSDVDSTQQQTTEWGLTGLQSETITRTILCCDEPEGFGPEVDDQISQAMVLNAVEEIILNTMHPVWFGRDEGYHGEQRTRRLHSFARPSEGCIYVPLKLVNCPNGQSYDKPLFLQKDAFEGEQWAPYSNYTNDDVDVTNAYILVGTLSGDASSTCRKYEDLTNGMYPPWTEDDSHTDLKKHVLCCMNPDKLTNEEVVSTGMNSIWLDQSHGWKGGSYTDGEQFCDGLGGKKLCPYTAYCPHGPGQNPMGGHSADFNREGEQWSPVYGTENQWVLIGRKYENSAFTCLTHHDLEGSHPDWGLTADNSSAKLHIMCCSL
ncbi:hypothetical protein ACHAXA_005204 [Cyclostephanos tholiformis]|uniref:DUF7495 domain-containing protein n=1 Tax=Cyclostephanos tholiformis TaxID=382380 RepID=A0ABD3SF34_9STRA